MTDRLPVVLLAVALLVGCQSDQRRPEAEMSKPELIARGNQLIRQGESRKAQGMGMGSNMQRRAGPNRADVIRDGVDDIQHGQRLKARAAGMPD